MATNQSALETKTKQLQITVKRTTNILDKGDEESIERHLTTLRTIISDVEKLRLAVEVEKIAADEDTSEWENIINGEITQADNCVRATKAWLSDNKKKQNVLELEEKLQFEVKLHETKLKMQAELEQNTKLTSQASSETSSEKTPCESGNMIGMQAKLPKLAITKFNGAYTDWPRFWGQFNENIDKTSIPAITKFAYLRELLSDKVKHVVEALPFSPEGYNRAKSILLDKFGRQSEIAKIHMKVILDLPTISSASIKQIHEFADKLSYNVQALETMKKLDQVNGAVSMTLDKLPKIRGDLVRSDPEWENWNFCQLVEALKQWTKRNPLDDTTGGQSSTRVRDTMFHASRAPKPRGCVYCDSSEHKANECSKITSVSERKQILAKRRLCFNCACGNHKASECASKIACKKCNKRHHTSICDSDEKPKNRDVAMTTGEKSEGIFPIVVLEVNGMRCRALIDSGAGSSYVSARLIDLLNMKPVEVETKNIDMLLASKAARFEIYNLEFKSTDHQFSLTTKVTKINKSELLTVPNPNYTQLCQNHPHLKGVTLNDESTKPSLPVHVVLGSGDYARIKTVTKPRIGNDSEPIAELTKFGWFLMSPGKEFDHNVMMLTQTTHVDYEELCRLDVLGLKDSSVEDQSFVFEEFKEQLTRSPEGWYETSLPWKPNHPFLPNNKQGSLKRLASLHRKLQKDELFEKYDSIIQDQLASGIIEEAPAVSSEKEFYIPHKYVIRKSAESTKMRIVYDASARVSPDQPSLNECLYAGPALQNKLWDVLVQQRSFPVMVSGDIKQAFLQIRVRESERDALRFHWSSGADSEILAYRFTRVLFGLAPSPFLLGGVLEHHLSTWSKKYPDYVERLRRSLYVDDILTGGQDITQAKQRKSTAIEIMDDAKFELHKWNSNVPELEDNGSAASDEQSFAKQQLQVLPNESKLLGLKWNKSTDTISVEFPEPTPITTKRGVLATLAKIYDPLGLVSPITLQGKLIYRDVCDLKASWDADLPQKYQQRWNKYVDFLPQSVSALRPIVPFQQAVESIELHAFGDASVEGVGAVVYSVVRQESGVTTSLVAAKSRLSKKSLTVPRLELVGAHMATNLVINVKNALVELPKPDIYAWLDSTVVLHWLLGNGQYKQFVANRVGKIKKHNEIKWRYVATQENPADIASRGSASVPKSWWYGPEWLPDRERWPENPIIEKSTTSEVEAKAVKEILAVAQTNQLGEDVDNVFDDLLKRHDLRRALRVQAWVLRFTTYRNRKGPLTSDDLREVQEWWIKREQENDSLRPHFAHTKQTLNLVKSQQGVLECHGRIQGRCPIYLPFHSEFTRKLVQRVHLETLHGGVLLTMAAVRETFWVPKLRQLVKTIRSKCWGCKRFTATPVVKPVAGKLPNDRTTGGAAFEVIGTDFAGPIRYRCSNKRERKSYLVIFACSLSRAIHLELIKNLETTTFLPCLKRLIARRGRPKTIYSDNGSTFVKASKWLKEVRNDERVRGLLETYEISWKFNLSRAPWWGGQFERLIGVVKSSMYKVIGGATLTWDELCEVILDVEIQINRRPLSYVEDDIELPTLTPTSFLFQRTSDLPESEPWRIEETDLRKRAKYLIACKNGLWRRWKREYLTALRERHSLVHKTPKYEVQQGDVVIVKTDDKNRGKWPLAIVEQLFPGPDGVTRAVQLKTKNGVLERPVQHLYPLEMQCDAKEKSDKPKLNPSVPPFRPKRAAAAEARGKISAIVEHEMEEV